MTDNLKLVDVVVEIVDARLPQSSRNPLIHDLIGEKPRALVMAKSDLAEEAYNKAWVAHFRELGYAAIACDFKGGNSKNEIKAMTDRLRTQARDILDRRQKRGIQNRTVRAMITGIPNVGKSTMINLIAGKAMTDTADRPGVTRGKQWIRLASDLELLDMPGILWPNLEDREGARKLAVTGAIGDNAYSHEELAWWLIAWLRTHRPGRLLERYGVSETAADYAEEAAALAEMAAWDMDRMLGLEAHGRQVDADGSPSEEDGHKDFISQVILQAIGRRRGLLRKGGVVETDKAAVILLDELRGGKLGRITWDELPDAVEAAEAESIEGGT